TTEEYLIECLRFTKNTEMNTYRLEALATLGLLRGTQGKSNAGRKILRKACSEAQKIPLKWFYCKTLLKSMLFEISTGNYLQAEQEIQRLSEAAKHGASSDMKGWAAYGLAIVELNKRNLDRAISLLLEAEQIGESVQILPLQYYSKMVLADIYLMYYDIKKSTGYYKSASNIIEESITKISDEKLRTSFLNKYPIKKILLRGKSRYADISSAYYKWDEEIYEESLLNTVKEQLGSVAKRRYQTAGIILQLDAFNLSPDLERLAEIFDRHKRTIIRDIKAISY
ncbi:MAG: hypothetical protein ACOC2J_01740, partial [bacterium]